MVNSMLICGIILGVSVAPIVSDDDPPEKMTVCQEEDNDLRVDCRVEPKPNQISDYEFSMSKGSKETVIYTNISGIMPDPIFRYNAYVEELEPYGFRLTMTDFTLSEDTTFVCKISKAVEILSVEEDEVEPCSAISVFLQSYPWMLNLLFSLCNLQIWGLGSL